MKVNFESIKKRLKKHWALIWLVSTLFAVSVFVVFASYTGVNSVKRVVSTRPADSVMFSSNSLKSSATSQRLSSTAYTITVCNFAQENALEVNPDNITYTLNASLAIKNGNDFVKLSEYTGADKADYISKLKLGTNEQRTYSIQFIKDDENATGLGDAINLVTESDYSTTFTTNCALKGTVSSTDSFKIILDDAEQEKTEPEFYIYVEAVPSSPASLHATLSNYFGTAESTAEAASWTGELVESDDCSSVSYDFYNYVLTGSGVGTVDIMWDSTKFEINEFFFSELSGNEFVLYDSNGEAAETGSIIKNATRANWKMVTLMVDSTDINRYQIQLYKVDGETQYIGTNSASNFIDCEFHSENSSS